jgi:hypothetical protein
MPRQDPARVLLDFTKRYGFKPTCAFKAKTEAADAAEQVEDLELGHVVVSPVMATGQPLVAKATRTPW